MSEIVKSIVEDADDDDPAWQFRVLYNAILDDDGGDLHQDILTPWLARNARSTAWLREFSQRQGSPVPPATTEELWILYAAGRVNDLLLQAFQPNTLEFKWAPPGVSREDHLAFMTALGFEVVEFPRFSPFYHEIVAVTEADDEEEPATVTGSFWPCLMLGPMLFARAGVRVRAGRRHLRKDIAPRSKLFWAHTRRNRACEDLSHSWGHNSQWRTGLRRDYRFGQDLWFNVDGCNDVSEHDLPHRNHEPYGLAERTELVTHRCYVVTEANDDEAFPYRWTCRLTLP